jgi:hypothetical protein
MELDGVLPCWGRPRRPGKCVGFGGRSGGHAAAGFGGVGGPWPWQGGERALRIRIAVEVVGGGE